MKFIYLFCLLLVFNMLIAQPTVKLFTFLDESNIVLNDIQNQRLSKLENLGGYSNLYYAQINNLKNSQDKGKVLIQFPFSNCGEVVYSIVRNEYESESNYKWYGVIKSIDSCDCGIGELMILSKYGEKLGNGAIGNKAFEIYDLTGGLLVFAVSSEDVEYNEVDLDSTNVEPIENNNINDINSSASEGNCPVRVLIMYTTDAENNHVGDINLLAEEAIFQTNNGLRNSGITEGELTLELASREHTNFNDNNTITDMNPFANFASVRRDELEADIAVLLGDYGITGRAQSLSLHPDSAYCVIGVQATVKERIFGFAHEIGHVFGARHENDDDGTFEHAHKFRVCTKRYSTILKEGGGFSNYSILYYSNPDIKYKGHKTGVEGLRDNARKIKNSACTVANFKNTIVPLSINLILPMTYCPCDIAPAYTVVSGGVPGPYQFYYEFSNDGINWYPVTSYSGSTAYIETSCSSGDLIAVRVTVTSIDGQVNNTIRWVESVANPNCEQEMPCANCVSKILQPSTDIIVYPNPTQGGFNLQFYLFQPQNTSVYYEITDVMGRMIKTEYIDYEINEQHTIHINTTNMSNGTYYLKFVSNGISQRKTINITK